MLGQDTAMGGLIGGDNMDHNPLLLHMDKNGTMMLLLSSCPSEVIIITEVGPLRQGLGSGLEKVAIPNKFIVILINLH